MNKMNNLYSSLLLFERYHQNSWVLSSGIGMNGLTPFTYPTVRLLASGRQTLVFIPEYDKGFYHRIKRIMIQAYISCPGLLYVPNYFNKRVVLDGYP